MDIHITKSKSTSIPHTNVCSNFQETIHKKYAQQIVDYLCKEKLVQPSNDNTTQQHFHHIYQILSCTIPEKKKVQVSQRTCNKKILNRGTGAGGSNTNNNGLPYEEQTNLDMEEELNYKMNKTTQHIIAMEITSPKPKTLMSVICPHVKQIIENKIIQNMSVIQWGKAMARFNEIILKDILKSIGIEAYDPETDVDCPEISIANNSPGFDILAKNSKGKMSRIQCKLRQVKGVTDFSQQTHFETTRRHSKKNEGNASDSGHVAYGCDEFDYVMISLVNVGKDGKNRINRNNIDKWSFSLIPVETLIDKKRGCCYGKISSKILNQYKFDPKNPRLF